MLLLGIVQQKAELHALAGEFAVGQRAHAGQDDADAGLGVAVQQRLARRAVRRPVADHLGEIADQQVGCRLQILRAPVAMAAGAVGGVVVGVADARRRRPGAVQVLPPQQELDGVIAGRHIGLDVAGFLQRAGQEFRRDAGGVDLGAIDLDRRGWR